MGNNVIRSVAIIVIGLMLMFWSESVAGLFIRIAGAAFFLPALVSIVRVYMSTANEGAISRAVVSIVDVGCMAFGLWLMIAPASFEVLFVKTLAVLLLLFALYQGVIILFALKAASLSAWLLVMPLALIVVAVLLFTVTVRPLEILSVVFGAVAVVSGMLDLVLTFMLRKKRGVSNVKEIEIS